MTLRWDPAALAELAGILDFIAEDDPVVAQAVARRIRRSVDLIERFPAIGVVGSVPGTRVHVVPGLPYILVYRMRAPDVEVLSIFHAARDRPR